MAQGWPLQIIMRCVYQINHLLKIHRWYPTLYITICCLFSVICVSYKITALRGRQFYFSNLQAGVGITIHEEQDDTLLLAHQVSPSILYQRQGGPFLLIKPFPRPFCFPSTTSFSPPPLFSLYLLQRTPSLHGQILHQALTSLSLSNNQLAAIQYGVKFKNRNKTLLALPLSTMTMIFHYHLINTSVVMEHHQGVAPVHQDQEIVRILCMVVVVVAVLI